VFLRVLLASISISVISFFITLSSEKEKRVVAIERSAELIKDNLIYNLDYVRHIMEFAGREILKKDYTNLNKIHEVFVNLAKSQNITNSVICWTFLDWLDRNDRQLVNTITGINKNPPNMHKAGRRYGWRNIKEPKEIEFSAPGMGIPSGEYIIPAGMWIEKNEDYLGGIALGISINKLANKIIPQINENVRFAVINSENYQLIFRSNNLSPEENNNILNQYNKWAVAASTKNILFSDGFIEEKIKFGSDKYIYLKNLNDERYPFKILIGYDEFKFYKDVILKSLIIFIQSFIILLTLYYLIRRKI
jgi:hypothetical protein